MFLRRSSSLPAQYSSVSLGVLFGPPVAGFVFDFFGSYVATILTGAALAAAGHRRFSVVHGQGLLQALSAREQTYSVELGELITQQIQLDVYCVDDELAPVLDLIQRNGRTGQATSGWLFISSIDHAYAIDGN